MIGQYGKSEDLKGLTQVFATLASFVLLWWLAIRLSSVSPWLAALPLPLIVLLIVRAFGLMHECGHGSLFRSPYGTVEKDAARPARGPTAGPDRPGPAAASGGTTDDAVVRA